MTKTETLMFWLGWALLLHGIYTISPVAMEILIALNLLVASKPAKGSQ